MLLIAILLFAVGFFTLAIILQRTYDFAITDSSIVIEFIGTLATFIVVSNYIQLKNAEDKIEGFKSDLDNFSIKFKQLEDDLTKKFVGRTVNMASGVTTASFDLNEAIDSFTGAEVKYSVVRGSEIELGNIRIGRTIGSLFQIDVTGDCEVIFDCKTVGVIFIKKEGNADDEVSIRFLVL